MFAFHLSLEEKQAMLRLVGYLASSDREVSPTEQQFVLDLAHDLNISADGVFEQLDAQTLAELCAPFTRKSARRIVLVELLNLALSDHILFTEERAALEEITRLMDIPLADTEAIEDWVRRGNKWHAEGHLLLGLQGDQKMDV